MVNRTHTYLTTENNQKENDSKGRRGHYACWALLHAESNWILSLLAGRNVYDVVQQTNKPLVVEIAWGGWLKMLQG